MRQTRLKTSLLILATVSTVGCHQATGPTGGTALSPVSPLTGGGATTPPPRLGPFGSPTRVAPPGTGSYGTANNYLGGVAPVGATSSYPTSSYPVAGGPDPAGTPAAHGTAPTGATSMGFGIQTASWSQNDSPSRAAFGASTDSPMLPQLDGMRVNDLTQAPPPPGYQPFASIGWPAPAAQTPNVGVTQPGFQTNEQATGQAFSNSEQAVRPVAHEAYANTTPAPTQSLQPLPTAPALQQFPAASSRSQFPSTEPSTAKSELPWRAPTPRY